MNCEKVQKERLVDGTVIYRCIDHHSDLFGQEVDMPPMPEPEEPVKVRVEEDVVHVDPVIPRGTGRCGQCPGAERVQAPSFDQLVKMTGGAP